MHFSWERVPQLTQVRCQYEVSSKEENRRGGKKKRDGVCFILHGKHMCDTKSMP